jgi:hypothetical protein
VPASNKLAQSSATRPMLIPVWPKPLEAGSSND